MTITIQPAIEWHCSEEDGGPDVGISFAVNDKLHVWCGEISRDLFERSDAEALGDDFGWFIVIYDESKPREEHATLLARVADRDRGEQAARLVALGLMAANKATPS